MPEWKEVNPKDGELRYGKYHGSYFPGVPELWIKNWIVVAELNVDFQKYEQEGYDKESIVQGCVNYLNLEPPRKKYAKKQTKPLYGKLKLYKICKLDNEKVQVLLITDRKKNKHFWGEGARR